MLDSAGLDPALPIEAELFAREEILGRERAYRARTENQELHQIGKQLKSKQTEFHDRPMSFLSKLILADFAMN
jgi:hypothetical protein